MARVPCNRLAVLAFVILLLLGFVSISHGARSLGVVVAPPSVNVGKADHVQVKTTPSAAKAADGQVHNDDELVTVDYTPAKKKPPIHN